MVFGPEISIKRLNSADGRVSEVTLAPFNRVDAASILPFSDRDLSLRYLGAYEPGYLLGDPNAYYDLVARPSQEVGWGVYAQRKLKGFASLSVAGEPESIPSYGVTLAEIARGRGIGSLATAALMAAAFKEGFLHSVNSVFASSNQVLTAAIHPDNHGSRYVSESMGFVFQGQIVQEIEEVKYYWDMFEAEKSAIIQKGQDRGVYMERQHGAIFNITFK
jgi:GNAT superfamily N-acetyltransferase